MESSAIEHEQTNACAGLRAHFVAAPWRSQAPVGFEQRDGLVVRQRLGDGSVAAYDALGAPYLAQFMREQTRTVVG
jgi:hypothetical protein